MKRIISILMLTCVCLSCSSMENVYAEEYPHATVPFSYGGFTYDSYISYNEDSYRRRDWVFSGLSDVIVSFSPIDTAFQTSISCNSTSGMTRINEDPWYQYTFNACGFNLFFPPYDPPFPWRDPQNVATNFPGISTAPISQSLLPFSYNNLTYTQKVIGYDFDGTAAGYERELYTPANSGIWINHSGQDSHGDFLVTGLFTGNASETISAHDGILDNSGFQDHIQLNETKNCFATIKSNVDIRWTTNLGQYGNTDNCGSYHAEGDLVVPKNLNENGTEPTGCIFPEYCVFPNFTTSGANVRDRNNASDLVFTMDVFDGVPSFLNSQNDGSTSGSYYQCTEFVARYLHSRFGTDYSDSKNVADNDTQGFRGFDFHPNYGGNPTVDKTGSTISLASVSSPRAGDVAMFSSGHAAVVKSTDEATAKLVEQNFIVNGTYTKSRVVDILAAGTTFFRYPAAVVGETNSVSSTVQDAYNSASDGQTVKMQTQVFNENLDLSNSVAVSLLGGYDPNFQTVSGWTTIFGSLTIRSGTVVVDCICIQ